MSRGTVKMLWINFFTFFTGFAASKVTDPSIFKLELVQTIFRHGDRIPEKEEIFPTNAYTSKDYEPYGYGRLTNIGREREYKIGQMLRERYGNFLGDTYKPDNVHGFSTDFDRTKESLELVLAALYPPNHLLRWNRYLNWIPIAVNYNPKELNFMQTTSVCPEYEQLLNEVWNLPEVRKKFLKFDKETKYISEKMGLKKATLNDLSIAFEVIQAHQSMGLPLPKWLSPQLYKQYRKIVEMVFQIRSYTTELKRLSAGPTVQRFIKNINNQDDKRDPRKIYLYSSHDLNLHAFLKAHGLLYPQMVGFGTAVIVEKLRGPDNGVYVRLLVWTGANEQLVPLKLNDCFEICPLSRYLEIVKPILPQGTGTECLLSRLNNDTLRGIVDGDL